MESRSSRRYPTLGSYEPVARSPLSRSPTARRGARSCSFILLLQVCLALLCGSFFVQWLHWTPTALVSRDARHATADTGHLRRPGGLTFGDLQGMKQNDKAAAAEPTPSQSSAPAPAPLQQAQHEDPQTPMVRTKPRVFVPPNSSASSEEIAAWRKRFHPSRHNADQRKVASMLAWAWGGYEKNAFGQDYLNVQTMKGDGLPGHDMAITLVDSLDTLFVVGMFEEFDRASEWVRVNMKDRIYKSGYISLFETTIRNLGGLLSAYYLSGQKQLLEAAEELGQALSPAFQQYKHGFPGKDFDVLAKSSRDSPSIAEAGTLQLEFKYLARATGEKKYYDQVENIMVQLFDQVHETYTDGLLPAQISVYTGRITNSKITLGAYGDSYYEYLLKQWLLSGKADTKYRTEYIRAVNGIRDRLVAKSQPNGYTFIGELVSGQLSPKMDHLVCFVPGLLALGYIHGMPADHLELAKDLLETCYQMYDQMEAKLAPEIMYFNMDKSKKEDLDVHSQDAFNLQRPETIESLMILYRVTKDEKYREYGRVIMDAFEKHTKLPGGGYTTISNVKTGPVRIKFRDGMESFFLAETLKYLFLLFSDDETMLPLDEIVFNTEAHPFPMAG